MGCDVDALEGLLAPVDIALGRSDVSVPTELLGGVDVSGGFEYRSNARVSKSVRVHS